MAVAARTIDDSLGRLSQRVAVKVKPEDVPLNLRGEGVTTHTMRLTWGPPIRYTWPLIAQNSQYWPMIGQMSQYLPMISQMSQY